MVVLKISCQGSNAHKKGPTKLLIAVHCIVSSVRQTDSALSNLSLNIHRHVEVQITNLKK